MAIVVVSVARERRWAGNRASVAMVAALAIVLSGCSAWLPDKEPTTLAETHTEADGAVLKLTGATVALPQGAVPQGTLVTAAIEEPETSEVGAVGGEFMTSISKEVHVNVAEPLAEGTYMTLTMTLDPTKYGKDFVPSSDSMVLVHHNGLALEEELVPVNWNQETGEASSEISAFVSDGRYRVVKVNVPGILDATETALQKTADAATQKPACTDQPVTANGVKLTTQSATGVWVCLREKEGLATVSVMGQQAVPRRVVVDAMGPVPSALDQNVLNPYFHAILQPLLSTGDALAVAMPGAAVEISTSTTGFEKADWEFQPYPAMFLLNYLATMVDAAHIVGKDSAGNVIDATQTAACIGPTLRDHQDAVELDNSWAATFVEEVMDCIKNTLKTDHDSPVLLDALVAAPILVADSAVALWKAQKNRYSTTVTVTGELQWTTYTTTLNSAKVSFQYPVSWTVKGGSLNEEFGDPRQLLVFNSEGKQMAEMIVIDVFSAYKPTETATAVNLGAVPATHLLAETTPLEVHALAIDAADIEPARQDSPWEEGTVKLSTTLGKHVSDEDLIDHDVNTLPSWFGVDTGVKLSYSDDPSSTWRYISFEQKKYFDSMDQAKDYVTTTEFATVQKMLASFQG